jgi:hypothetical protein
VERINLFLRRWPHVWYRAAYGVAIGFFVWNAAQFYVPGKGFTYLILFGGSPGLHHIRELQSVDYYVHKDSYGYDGQYYAQLAVKPILGSRDLRAAMDNLPYRARRILFCWSAYAFGLGQPGLVLQVFAVQNIIAWLLLAWVLLRWFPPTGPGNLVRWAGTMFAWGMTLSVSEALMDGPSLLLIACGVTLAEQGRRWSSACVLGIAGLGRETNLLAGLAHLPGRDWGWRETLRSAGRGVVIVAPLALWVACLWYVFREPSNTGLRNFAPPFSAGWKKWSDTLREFQANGWDSTARWSLLMMISLSVQFLVIVLRPQWTSPWWRIGAAYALLMIFLGSAVWDGFPGAAARVLVPMTLAFNVVVPRGRWWWWLVLLLGNLSALSAVDQLRPPGHESFLIRGPAAVWEAPARQALDVTFTDQWYESEQSSFEYWRWSRGSAVIVIRNPQIVPVEIELDFDLRAVEERTVRVFQGDVLRWEGRVGRESTSVHLPQIELEPGANRWRFEPDGPPSFPNGDRLRPVSFNLRNLVIYAVRRIDRPKSGDASRP